jgi:two-component system, NarL family, nitrate/nitrite sensor histidine kinase NarQ
VVKHAQASEVILRLAATPPMTALPFEDWQGEIKMVVKDNGIGFSPGGDGIEHFGLGIMRERAAAINAIYHLESQSGLGTEVVLIWHKK